MMALGCDAHIAYRGIAWEHSDLQYDFVMDTVGGDSIGKSLEIVKTGGTIISIPSALRDEVQQKAKQKNVITLFFPVSSHGYDMAALADWLRQEL